MKGIHGRFAPLLVILLLIAFHATATLIWLHRNTLPNGYQNEILHLGYLLDFYSSLKKGITLHDWYDFKYYLSTGYWPPLFYLSAFPNLALFGVGRVPAAMTSIPFLALLLAFTYLSGKEISGTRGGLFSAAFLSFLPSIYGNLRRFEPNIGLTALLSVSLYLLLKSRGFTKASPSLLTGMAGGAGMLMDRVSFILFFSFMALYTLIQGVVESMRFYGPSWKGVKRPLLFALFSLLIMGAMALPYYLNFYRLYRGEVVSQIGAGEIDERGELLSSHPPFSPRSLLYYPLSLIDSQAGVIPGLLILFGLAHTLRERRGGRSSLLVSFLLPLFVLTMISKKQSFYSIPLLLPCSLMAGDLFASLKGARARALLSTITAFFLLNTWTSTSFDKGLFGIPASLPLLNGSAGGWRSHISPWYPQSSPPIRQDLGIDEILSSIEKGKGETPLEGIGLYSEYHGFHERYLHFFVSTRSLEIPVKGLVMDPRSFFEWLPHLTLFVYVSDHLSRRWPTTQSLTKTLTAYSYIKGVEEELSSFPALEGCFESSKTIPIEEGRAIYIYLRRANFPECPGL